MSEYINKYFLAVTSTSWKDGDYEEIVYCYATCDKSLTVRNRNKITLFLSVAAIKRVMPRASPIIKFAIGSDVEFVYNYHQMGGDTTLFGKIMGYDTFYNDVTYSIYNYTDGKTCTYYASAIKCLAVKPEPKYAKNQYVGVVTIPAMHQLADDLVENATIISINIDFAKITYDVQLDSNNKMTVAEYSIRKPIPPPKTDAQIKMEDEEYLCKEELRLMQQLEEVRDRLKKY